MPSSMTSTSEDVAIFIGWWKVSRMEVQLLSDGVTLPQVPLWQSLLSLCASRLLVDCIRKPCSSGQR